MVDNSTNISTKSPTTSYLKSLKSKIDYMTYANDNPRPDLEQAWKCDRVKPVKVHGIY